MGFRNIRELKIQLQLYDTIRLYNLYDNTEALELVFSGISIKLTEMTI